MQITIYVKNKPVYLTSELTPTLEELHYRPDTIFIDEVDTHSIKAMLREIALPEINCGIFLHSNLPELQKKFFKKFELHVAGGGLGVNNNGAVLMIFRRGYWDLPKGHQDKGETIEDCAIREVQEETGLSHISITRPLITTYHTYEQGTHHILKESHWYLMQLNAEETLTPQTEEDIERAEWVKPKELQRYIAQAYPSIRDVLSKYINAAHLRAL